MRLDRGIEDQKLALDITPLIDIIFLLVLFFAVSTSFISGEDLADLQTNVVTLGEDRERLTTQVTVKQAAISTLQTDYTRMVEARAAEIAKLAISLEASQGTASELEFMVSTLEDQRVSLETSLTDRDTKNASLQDQLKTAFNDFQNLNAELTSVRSESERQAENERLLRGLLDERARDVEQATRDVEQAAQKAGELDAQKAALAEQLVMLRGFIDDSTRERTEETQSLAAARDAATAELDTTRAQMSAQLDDTLAAVTALTSKLADRESALQDAEDSARRKSTQEVLLQKLLAEKAAELDGMQVRIEAAGTAQASLSLALKSSKDTAQRTTAELKAENQGIRTQMLRLQAELNKYREVDQLGREQIERILTAQAQLKEGMSSYLADKSLGIKQEKQRLTLQLSDKILFASGSPNIKAEGLEVLRNIGVILKERMSQLDVLIGGHTDNVPVTGRRGPLADNWGLSAARAVNVVRFFEEQVGMEPGRIAAVGYGEHRPVADNATATGRAQNRRIEIVLLPR